jgi:hypothetical protein
MLNVFAVYKETRRNKTQSDAMHLRIGNTVITKKTNAKTNAKENTYEIKNDVCPHLIKSVAAISGSSSSRGSSSSGSSSSSKSFEARTVMPLKEYLKRCNHATELYVALCLLRDLGRQMQALLSGGHGIACFSVDDVVIIAHRESDAFTHSDPESTLGPDPQFLFLNDRLIFEVDESDGTLLIDRALNANAKTAFVAPELAAKQEQEQERVHFKTAYHSAAQLLIYFLLGKSDPSLEQGLNGTSLNLNLNPIKGTKLYWFLLRCLNRVPSERSYVYV